MRTHEDLLRYRRRWRRGHRDKGLCTDCSRASVPGSTKCLAHARRVREYMREIRGSSPWRYGIPGAPPAEARSGLVERERRGRLRSIRQIQRAVAAEFALPLSALCEWNRTHAARPARLVAIGLSRRLTGSYLEDIASAFGLGDASASQRALSRLEHLTRRRKDVRATLASLEGRLGEIKLRHAC